MSFALMEFAVGVADVLVREDDSTRSMLIHPSRYTDSHGTFVRWVTETQRHWQGSFEEELGEQDLKASFRLAWDSMHVTDKQISSFEQCWQALPSVVQNLRIVEMNTREGASTPLIDWDSSIAFILVGGQALDRGFTVDGLSVTYMPRDPGSWTADSIQQRARFFGYKRTYFAQCRVYLEPNLRDAFGLYVEHERHMLASLRAIQQGKITLKDWRREFLLSPSMKATRQSVVSLDTVVVSTAGQWIFDPRPPAPGYSPDLERSLVDDHFGTDKWEARGGHRSRIIPLADVVQFIESVSGLVDSPIPSVRVLNLQLAMLLDLGSGLEAEVVDMRPGKYSDRTLRGGLIQPFQGRSRNYDGDRAEFNPELVTVQLHWVAVRASKTDPLDRRALVCAVRVPGELGNGWLVEAPA
ncbi:hypothetical protein C5C50_14765 [Rathayibacter sp. AY1D9]|nr:hypothetical protein C5C50_14765 [Rathayibacter sp. AY1D9]